MEHTNTPARSRPRSLPQSTLETGWLLLVILTPLTVNLWGVHPFELPKIVLLRTLVWLLAGLTLTQLILTRRSLWQALRANPLTLPLALLALTWTATTISAVDPRLSLWGSSERGFGLLTWLTLMLLAWLSAEWGRSVSRVRTLLAAASAATLPLLTIALMQAAGWQPLAFESDVRSAVFATLGRANFVGAYLAMLLPISLALAVLSRDRRTRWAWIGLLALQGLVVGLTLTRAAWLASAVALAIFGVGWWGRRLPHSVRWLLWSGVALLALSGPLLVWLSAGDGGSSAARIAIWQGAATLIADRPLLGYGSDAFGLAFAQVYPPELVYAQGRDFFVDRAHNWLLDSAVAAGLPGLLALLLLLVTAFWRIVQGWQRALSPVRRALLLAISAALVANLSNNLVSFDVAATAMLFWLLLGLGVGLSRTDKPAISAESDAPFLRHPFWKMAFFALLALGLTGVIWQANVRPLAADVVARQAYLQAERGHWQASLRSAERAVALWPHDPSHHQLMSEAAWQLAQSPSAETRSWLAQSLAAEAAARELRPLDPQRWLFAAHLRDSAERQFGVVDAISADDAYRRALTLAPTQATIYTAWGRSLLTRGDPEAAAKLLRQAVLLDASSGEAYLHLAAAERALGRPQTALADAQEAVRLLPDSPDALAMLAWCYHDLGRDRDARRAAEQALHLNPTHSPSLQRITSIDAAR